MKQNLKRHKKTGEVITDNEQEEIIRFWKQTAKEASAAKEELVSAQLKFAKRILELAESSGLPTVVEKAAEMRAMFLTTHPFPPLEVLTDFINRIGYLSHGHLPDSFDAKAIGETFLTREAVEWMAQFGEAPTVQ
jgi:hypothetical protein